MPKEKANLIEAIELLSEHGTVTLTRRACTLLRHKTRWWLHFYDAACREQRVQGLTPESAAQQAMDIEDEAKALPKRPDADLLLDMVKEGNFPVCPAKAKKIIAKLLEKSGKTA